MVTNANTVPTLFPSAAWRTETSRDALTSPRAAPARPITPSNSQNGRNPRPPIITMTPASANPPTMITSWRPVRSASDPPGRTSSIPIA